MILKYFFPIIFVILSIDSQSTEPCGCDFFPDSCDLLCCCDLDCDEADKLAFNCQNETLIDSKKYCVPSGQFFKSNTPYIIKEIENLVCIEKEREVTYDENSSKYDISEEQLSALVNSLHPDYMSSNLNSFDQDREYFTISDRLWTISPNNLVSYLSLPFQKKNNVVSNGLPVNYLINKESTLRYPIASVNWITTNIDFTTLTAFLIIPKPNSLKECESTLEKPETEINFFTECTDNLIPISTNVFYEDGSEICLDCQLVNLPQDQKNSISRMRYIFEYMNPDGVKRAVLEAWVKGQPPQPPKAGLTYNELVFEVSYVKDLDNQVENQKLSGNPGYIIGETLVAGQWNSSFIEIPTNRDIRFTAMLPSLECSSDTNSRIPIKFQINYASECTYSIPKQANTPLQTICNDLQQNLAKILLGTVGEVFRPNYIASYGNLIESKNNTTDFVEISYPEPNAIINTDSISRCFEISNKLSIEIAYAYVGNEYNKQAKIVKVVYNWNNTVNYNFKCLNNLNCEDRISVFSRVTFVDVSLPPVKTEQKLFKLDSIIPADFFAPFS